jgi:hypothetical protein
MRRLALIVAAPVAAAIVLAVTSVYEPGSGSVVVDQTAASAGLTSSEPSVSVEGSDTLVLGGQAGENAVGLSVLHPREGRLDLEASVLGPDGTGVDGLDVELAAAGRSVRAEPCGEASYCGTLEASTPVRVTVRIGGDNGPGIGFDVPKDWRPAGALVADATDAYRALQTVQYTERLWNGSGTTLRSTWHVEAPDRLSYTIANGPSGVVIGNRRWDRAPGSDWIESPQDPLPLPEPPWTSAVAHASILGSESVEGRDAWIVSFLDEAALPTWFTLWIDKQTRRTLKLSMTTSAHFMRQAYTAFDEPVTIVPPR